MLTGYVYMNGDVGKISTGAHYSPPEPLTVSTATNTSYRYVCVKKILFLRVYNIGRKMKINLFTVLTSKLLRLNAYY